MGFLKCEMIIKNLNSSWTDQTKRKHENFTGSFFEATNNAAMRHNTCGVCGRYRMESEAHFTTKPISEIPNCHRLKSQQDEARQVYVEGLLLEPKGCIFMEGKETEVRMCKDCLNSLKRGGKEDLLPPHFSYANGL